MEEQGVQTMSYHPLANETGGTAEDRRNEADRIIGILADHIVAWKLLNEVEYQFVQNISPHHRLVSAKQLFWLRDIKDKYL
jgi:hypothetical protein